MNNQNSDNKKQSLTHLISFLNGCRQSQKDLEGITTTHLSFGDIIQGKFVIPVERNEEFIELYTEAIKYHQLSILEIPTVYNPIFSDITLTATNVKDNGRLYENDDIINLLNIYIESLNKLFDIKKNKFFIFEKPNIKTLDDLFKDGFHIRIPEIITTAENKYKLRSLIVAEITNQKLFNNCIIKPDLIINKSVIKNKPYFLYNSSKPNNEAYKLTRVYNNKLKDITYKYNLEDTEGLIKIFSIYTNLHIYNISNLTPCTCACNSICVAYEDTEYNKYWLKINKKIKI